MNDNWVYLNGAFCKLSEASLPITDLALLRGYGIFDFFRTHNKRPFQMEHHFDRFYTSADGFRLKIPVDRDALSEIIEELLKKNRFNSESGFKLVLTGGNSLNGYKPTKPNFFILHQEVTFPDPVNYQKGARLLVSEYLRDFGEIKSLNYLHSVFHIPQMEEVNAVDVLYHSKGRIFETSRSNIFIVKDGIINTPIADVLKGISRKTLLRLLKGNIKVVERPCLMSEIETADEIFITSSVKKVMPIRQVGDTIIAAPGPITTQAMKMFATYENLNF